MLGIRYHMRQMGEAADVPVGSFLFSLNIFIFHIKCLIRWRIQITRMKTSDFFPLILMMWTCKILQSKWP
jgi:hypothetical protein